MQHASNESAEPRPLYLSRARPIYVCTCHLKITARRMEYGAQSREYET